MKVLVFAERTGDVDNILEKLITSGVEAVAVHGGLDQQDREYAISSFKVLFTLLAPKSPASLGICKKGLQCSSNIRCAVCGFQEAFSLSLNLIYILDARVSDMVCKA